jgi:hypothetical protein
LPPLTPPHSEPRQLLPQPLQLLHILYAVCCLFVFRPDHTSDDVRECVQAHSRCTVVGVRSKQQQAGVPGGCEWIAYPLHKKGSAEARCACSTTSKHRDTRRRERASATGSRQNPTRVSRPGSTLRQARTHRKRAVQSPLSGTSVHGMYAVHRRGPPAFVVAAVALDVPFAALPDGRQGNVSNIQQAEPTLKRLFFARAHSRGSDSGPFQTG